MISGVVMAIGIISMCSCKVKRSRPVNQLRIFRMAAQLFFRHLNYKMAAAAAVFARLRSARV
jgi:hypothetical protein